MEQMESEKRTRWLGAWFSPAEAAMAERAAAADSRTPEDFIRASALARARELGEGGCERCRGELTGGGGGLVT